MCKLGPYDLNTIITGDARELSKAIPDCSVDLIFTDPVYDRIEDYEWLAETAARVLKPDRACLVFANTGLIPSTLGAMELLNYRWQFVCNITNGVKHRPAPAGKCIYSSLLWADKGKSKRVRFLLDLVRAPAFSSNSNYGWSKHPKFIHYYLEGFSKSNYIIFDPFTGGGTVPAVCKMLNRNYLAFEIDPDTADLARERVANTQPPLPFEKPTQERLID